MGHLSLAGHAAAPSAARTAEADLGGQLDLVLRAQQGAGVVQALKVRQVALHRLQARQPAPGSTPQSTTVVHTCSVLC